ncbi:hypothetical protein [Haloferax volcanii]|uniref:hypothetical protein n=1 Tax=Haloferax volcanii TaxID=2246 RepID=UPI00385D5E66
MSTLVLTLVTVISLIAWVPVGAAAVTNGADITHSNLSVTPTTLYEGSAVAVNVTVENTGASQQPYNTTLTVDGLVAAAFVSWSDLDGRSSMSLTAVFFAGLVVGVLGFGLSALIGGAGARVGAALTTSGPPSATATNE